MFIKFNTCKRILIIVTISIALLVVFLPLRSSNAMGEEFKTIVIDAGHGGFDGGAIGQLGTLESDINLEIAKRLEKSLKKEGFNVVMTRSTKDALGKNKKEDMQERKRIISTSNADFVLSIHTNKFSDSRRRGIQVFYDDTNKWQREGEIMQNLLNEYVNKKYVGRNNFFSLGGDFFITKCIDAPSLIIECGFISNREDEQLLKSKNYQEDIVKYIKYAIKSMFA